MITVTASISPERIAQWTTWLYAQEPSAQFSAFANFPQNLGLVPAYQALYEKYRGEHDIIAFAHDDTETHEPWMDRVLAEFDDPKVAIVGFGGALGIGTADIYKTPYKISQLQRIDYRSNQTDWDIHGARETGACDVAVVDGFFMACRTEFLKQVRGWSWFPHRFHCYDTSLCLMAHRKGWKVRMVGIRATHHGGGSSTTAEYVQNCRDRGTSVEAEHREPHEWMYDFFRPELPLRVK